MTACPSLDELLRLDFERLGDEMFADLEEHLETCDRCRRTLDEALTGAFARGPAAVLPSLPGFVVDRELGRGAMGVVYLATRREDGRRVALKFLGGGPDDRARWRREAGAMRRLDHPGIVRLLDVIDDEPRFCLVLEYVPGGRLEDRLDEAPDPRSAAAVVESIARAIERVHEAGFLHLDLKPTNVLLVEGFDVPLEHARPKVADFGLVLPWGDPEATWTRAVGPRGTPSYMAPEQLIMDRDTIGPAADVYAIGAILYRMLAGRPPFLAANQVETYFQLRDRDPVPPRRLNPDVPPPLETICLACLHKDPARRYRSAAALADDLRRFLAGRRIAMRPTPRAVRAARWCRRNRAVAGLSLALSAAVVTLGATLFVVQAARLRSARDEQARAEQELADLEKNLPLLYHVLGSYHDFDFAGAVMDVDGDVSMEHLLTLMSQYRERLRSIRASGSIGLANLGTLGQLDFALADLYRRRTKRPAAEVMALLDEACAAYREAVRRAPGVVSFRKGLAWAEIASANLEIDRMAFDQVAGHAERAAALIGGLPTPTIDRPILHAIAAINLVLAEQHFLRREVAATRRWLRVNERLFGLGSPEVVREPIVCYVRAVTALGLGDESAALRALEVAGLGLGPGPAENEAQAFAAHWFQYRLGDPNALDGRSDRSAGGAIALIEADAVAFGIDEATTARFLDAVFCRIGTAQRAARELDAADRTADDYVAIARELAARRPGEATYAAMIASAYQQKAKNGWKRADVAEVERWLRRSVEATRRAAAMAAEDDEYRTLLADRERRLAELAAE